MDSVAFYVGQSYLKSPKIDADVQWIDGVLGFKGSLPPDIAIAGPRTFEPRSDDEDDVWGGTPSPKFRTTPPGGRLIDYAGFSVQQAPYKADLQFDRVSNLAPEARDLTNRPTPPSTFLVMKPYVKFHLSNVLHFNDCSYMQSDGWTDYGFPPKFDSNLRFGYQSHVPNFIRLVHSVYD
ncbi:hypothetical protein AVEN_244971-1 [Araneus ventricosus]|uniref:Uncharacterized protein n=1 Tax=Araneus ventricosus TaxID=182803 RepID=A0A4Y2F460_ARAVE|nr:hypothetical protein AVEN_244971-1 [Araneus ventricosus]